MTSPNTLFRINFSALLLLLWSGSSLMIRLVQGFDDSISSVDLSLSFLEMFLIFTSCLLVLLKKYVFILLASSIYFIDLIEFILYPVSSSVAVLIRLVLTVFAIGGIVNYILYRKNKTINSMIIENDEVNFVNKTIEKSQNNTHDIENYVEVEEVDLSEVEKNRKFGEILGLHGRIHKKEITRLWKELLEKYHPDKVSHLGEEFQRYAEKKTKDINKAYTFFKRKYKL